MTGTSFRFLAPRKTRLGTEDGWFRSLVGLVFLATLTLGCDGPPRVVKLPPPPVTVALPLERNTTDAAYFTGRTEGSEFVEVLARVGGYLTKIHFKPGTLIKEGDPLFDIDDRPYAIALEQAEGELDRTKARLDRTNLDLARAVTLVEKKIMAKEDHDRIVGDQAEAAAALRSAAAAVERAKLDLTWTKIKAPITGLVSRELITVGNLVVADQTQLTTIVRQDPMYVYFDIDERTVLKILQLIREGKFKSARENEVPIDMALGDDDTDSYPHHGYVNFVDNRLDPATATMRIRGTFANPMQENGSTKFTAGMFARVRTELGPPHATLMITERAILSDQDHKYVYVVNANDEVERRDIQLGALTHGLRSVEAGLSKDDRIVVNGMQRIRPGIKVEPKLVAQPERPVKPTAEQAKAAPPNTAPPTSPDSPHKP